MSLGVKQLWRVLSNSNGARGLSLIPRECTPALARAAPSSRSTLRALHSQPSLSDQSQPNEQHTTTEVHDSSGENPVPAAQTPTEPSRASPPREEAQEEAQKEAQTQARDVQDNRDGLSTAKPRRGRGSGLVSRLAEVPVRAHPVLESVFARPVTEYPDQYETRGSIRANMKDNHRQKILMGTRVPTQRTDWRAILRNLLQATPIYLPEQFADNVKVIIPRETAPRLLSDSDYSVWDIRSRTGCVMVLYNAGDAGYEEGTEDQNPYLIISGLHQSVNTAIDEILSVTRKVTIISRTKGTEEVLWNGKVDGEDLSLPEPIIIVSARRTPSQLEPYHVHIRADELPKPKEWTRKTFEEYVDTLIKSRMSSALAFKLYPEHGRHEMAVIEQLVAVFNDEVAGQAVTNAAFKMALHYMTRGGETWRPEVLSMFKYAQSRRVQLDVEVFNILAEAAVKSRSLYRFSAVLYLLVTRGYQPNLRTWILFLRMFEAEEVKRYVLQAMNDRGLFNAHGALRMIANEMAPHDAYRAVQLGWDVSTFLAKQDELYGADRKWVSIDALNKVFHVFGSYSKFAEIRQLLDLVFTGKLVAYPDHYTINTILGHCKSQRKLDLAVEFIQLFEGHRADNHITPLKLDDTACDILFDLALWQKKPHVLSIVWRYAHLMNATNFNMRQKGICLLAMNGTELKKEKLVRRLKLGDEERVQFVRNLFLGEYIQANGGEEAFAKVIAGIAKGEQERRREMQELAEQKEDDDRIPPSMAGWFQTQSLRDSSSSPTTPPSLASPTPSTPDHDHSNTQSQSQVSKEPRATRWGDFYGLFRSWTFASQYLHLQPAAPIGSLLRQALDRDRALHLALREDGLDKLRVEELMKPIEIPKKLRTKSAFEEVKKLFETEREQRERAIEKVGSVKGDRDGDGEVQEAMATFAAVREQAVDNWLSGGGGGGGDGNDEAAPVAENAHVDETAATAVAAAAKPKPSSPSDESKEDVVEEQEQEQQERPTAAATTVEAVVEVEVRGSLEEGKEEEAHRRDGKEPATTIEIKTPPATPVADAQETSPTPPTTSPLTTSPLTTSTSTPSTSTPSTSTPSTSTPSTLTTSPATTSPPSAKTPTKPSKVRKTEEEGAFKLALPSSSSSSSKKKQVKWEDLADL